MQCREDIPQNNFKIYPIIFFIPNTSIATEIARKKPFNIFKIKSEILVILKFKSLLNDDLSLFSTLFKSLIIESSDFINKTSKKIIKHMQAIKVGITLFPFINRQSISQFYLKRDSRKITGTVIINKSVINYIKPCSALSFIA